MFIMKIPVVYLCAVVYWAIKAEPRPTDGARLRAATADSYTTEIFMMNIRKTNSTTTPGQYTP